MARFLSLRYWVLVACVDFNDLRWFERQACVGDSTETLLLLEIMASGCIMTAAFFSDYVTVAATYVLTSISEWSSIFVRAEQRLGDG